tara:strand:- start:106 stop:651 length:546 start_codon:yes stop_codon:yes gene_type:complete
MQNLKEYNLPRSWDPGANLLKRSLWRIIGFPLLSSFIPGTPWRKFLLILFGAKIGTGGRIKPYVRITFPWKLIIENDCWIGEQVWIDNLDFIKIQSNVCISQKAYLCTGNHNFKKTTFDLITKPISIGYGTWIGAGTLISPGSKIGNNCVITFGSVIKGEIEDNSIMQGNPATFQKNRFIE